MRQNFSTIPKGLRPPAQGCEERATLGHGPLYSTQPQRGCVNSINRWFTKRRSIHTCTLCGILAFGGCDQKTAESPKPAMATLSVKLATAKKGDATRSILLPANVLPFQQATLYAKVAGYVKTVNVDKGDSVQAGALLADIEVPELIADRAKYKAELEVADLDYKRTSDAQKKAPDLVVPLTVDSARGRYDVAKANLERIETLLGFSKITAPFSGVITTRYVDPGAFIPAATSGSAARTAALFTVMDFTKVRIQAAVPEIEVPLIKTGLPVKVMVEELVSAKIEGTITRFSHALDEATKTMLAEIELPNPDGTLRPGMYANVRITVERKLEALVLPTDAVLFEKGRTSVFTVADNKAKRTTVKTGFNDNGWVEILDGVKLGDSVIVIGKQVIADGQPVKVGDL
jgi:membrane fusion protein (multidrug efflux system)